jgi:UDP-GlcNAc:undecaprenyl-phosphate GlcNAc-1-phosphate transferase
MIARTFAGRSIAMGGRDHPSHRLVALGLSEREAVVVLYAVATLAGAVASLSYAYRWSYVVVVVTLLVVGLVLFGVYLGRIQVYSEEEVNLTEGTRFVTFVANFAYKRQVATVVMDLVLIVLAYYCAYLLRYEDAVNRWQDQFFASLPILMASQLLAFGGFRVYQGVWRYTSLNDLIRLAKAASTGTVAAILLLSLTTGLAGYSRVVFVLDWLLLVVLVSGSRLSFRTLAETLRPHSGDLRRVVIYGAGDGGVMVLREVRNNRALQRRIVGFIDDDRSKHRTTVQGIPVLGGLGVLEEAIRTSGVEEVIVSSEKVGADRLSELTSVCQNFEVVVMRASLRLE